MNRLLVAAFGGLLFGVGLAISGMTRATKVLGFLDVTGAWDPSLAFVMGGAVGVYVLAVRLARRRGKTLDGESIEWPASTAIDAPLVVGAAIFGIGWGLGGFCPGPAIVSAAAGNVAAISFLVAMGLGMIGRHITTRG